MKQLILTIAFFTLCLLSCNKGNLNNSTTSTSKETHSTEKQNQENINGTDDDFDVPNQNNEDNKIYITTSKKAEPKVGINHWIDNFTNEFNIPANIPNDIEKVTIHMQFVVEKDGTISGVRVLGDKYELKKEVERTLNAIGKWESAQSNGVKVRSKITQPVTIRIN